MKKKCNGKCGLEKDVEEFGKDWSSKDRRKDKCKVCESEQTKNRKRKLKEGTIRAF
jgi:hypothetical protein